MHHFSSKLTSRKVVRLSVLYNDVSSRFSTACIDLRLFNSAKEEKNDKTKANKKNPQHNDDSRSIDRRSPFLHEVPVQCEDTIASPGFTIVAFYRLAELLTPNARMCRDGRESSRGLFLESPFAVASEKSRKIAKK